MLRYLLILLLLPTLALGATDIPDFSVSLLDYSPSPAQPGQVIDLYLEVASADALSTGASVTIVEDYPFTILDTADKQRAENLKIVSGTQRLQFKIRIAENAKDGIYPLAVRARTGGPDYEEITFDIDVQTFDSKLALARMEQFPGRIVPGERGELTLTLRNFDDRPLRNIDLTVDLTDSYDIDMNMNNNIAVQAMLNAKMERVNMRIASGESPSMGVTPTMPADMSVRKETAFKVLAPVGIGTQVRVPDLEGGETYVLKVPVQALPTVKSGIYGIPIYLSYNDENNNPFHVRTEIPVLIDMEPALFAQLASTSLRTTDFAGELTFTIANRGQSPLYFVAAELSGNDDITILTAPSSLYLGTLEPGESSEAMFTVIAENDDITIPLKVTYRDAFNALREEEVVIEHSIINKNYYRDLEYEMWLVWLILGGVVLALTYFYVARMRKTA